MTLPGNIAAAAAAFAAGALGNIEYVKIGDIIVSACRGLSHPSELEITEKVIGTGYPISDAARKVPLTITLDIVFVDPQISADALVSSIISGDASSLTEGWRDKKAALYALQDGKEIVTTTTHENSYSDTMVQAIDPVYDADNNWDGFFATVTMKQIKRQPTDGGGGLLDSALEALGGL